MPCVGRWFRPIVLHSRRNHLEGFILFRQLAILFSLMLLIGFALLRVHEGDDAAIEAYHTRVAAAVNAIPVDFNGWVGQQVPLPQSATNLLRPNALIARQYVNEDKGLTATLLVVHCKDSRDMAGHYPPRCYPANGWVESSENPVGVFEVDGQTMRVYGFERTTGQDERTIIVYSLFALPNGQLTTSMREVRKLSADYKYREYGAAQLQVVLDGDIDRDAHSWILSEMYQVAKPAIDAVLDARIDEETTEKTPGEGSE